MKNKVPIVKTLKFQIAGYYLVTSITLIFIFALVLYYSISNIILADTLETTANSVVQSGRYIEIYIEKLKALTDVLSNAAETKHYLETGDKKARESVVSMIDTILKTDDYFSSVILVSKTGEILSNEKALDMTTSDDMMSESWYVAAINSEGMPVLTSARQQAFSMDQKTWVISVGQEITNDRGDNIGVMLIDVKYDVIGGYLQDLMEGGAFIINTDNKMVYYPDVTVFTDQDKLNAFIELKNMKDGYDSKRNLLTKHYPIKGTNWMLVGTSMLEGLSRVRRQIFETVVLIGLILILIALGSGLLIAVKITRPFKALENAMSDLEKGLLKVPLDENGCYEVENLTRHFNQMADRIEQLLRDIKNNEKYLRTYELNALHSQINPHFLYNTLDSIVWMAEFNDSAKVIAITKALAQFFRLSLSKGEELITLKDEVAHVAQYLFIQKQRYGEQLQYEIVESEALSHVKVPKIIIQPIVENAIYHGIRNLENEGLIQIKTYQEIQNLVILITDNGVGFDAERIQRGDIKLGGIGLQNVNQRLKLYYGENSGLKIESVKGKGTEVKLVIPI
ncbi:sensor histidine kinase [Fusibacter sp. 3D3]|uniref:cache domain-containing sensor histidine kinase n=1 Tax=Fusibacter sp. 3D3 TaxID=1048380 RepID=UPI000852F0D4|nr:sensor histidine kinase [Fusibacter sp. 3D3]GAU77273.1 two-component sensor kinase yesM associated with MetSO reductase [Fusibacter sp. 3D3]